MTRIGQTFVAAQCDFEVLLSDDMQTQVFTHGRYILKSKVCQKQSTDETQIFTQSDFEVLPSDDKQTQVSIHETQMFTHGRYESFAKH